MSRRIIYVILLICIAGSMRGQDDTLQIDFSTYSEMKLEEALYDLSDTYGVYFSYNPELVEEIRVRKWENETGTIRDFLDRTLQGTGLDFDIIANTYVLIPREKIAIDSLRENFSLSGVIRDKLSDESLPFAAIRIRNTNISTTANTDGKFTLLRVPSDTSIIEISYLGYSPLRIRAGDVKLPEETVVFEMMPRMKTLPSVSISASNPELVEIDRRISTLTFNPIEISTLPNLGEKDVFSALRRLPGIGGGSDAESGLRIRGGTSGQNLVLFDGITVYHVDHFFGFLSAFNTAMIKNVQVYKGGYDARYGGRAAGVVNITGIDGNKIKPSFRAEANMLSVNLLGELPLVENKASLVVAYRRSYTDIILSPTYQSLFNNLYNAQVPSGNSTDVDIFDGENVPDFQYSDFNAKLNFQPSLQDAISLSFYRGRDELMIDFDGSFDGIRRISEDRTEWGNTGGSFKWSRKWNKYLFTYANYGVSRYESELHAKETYFTNGELFSRNTFDQIVKVNDNTFRLDNIFQINSVSSLEFGWWNSLYEVSSRAQDAEELLRDSVMEAVVNAVYAQYKRQMGSWNLTAGFRGSIYGPTEKFNPEPRIRATYRWNEKLTLKAAAGTYHQMIRKLNDRSLYLSTPETWTLAGPNTVPILKSNHYILGATYDLLDWEISAEAYRKEECGTVEFLFPQFATPTGEIDQYATDGEKRISGLDILVKKTIRNQNFLFSYTYLKAESRFEEINGGAYFRSSGTSTHEGSLVYSLNVQRWDFSAGFVLTSGQPYTPVLGTYVVDLPNGESRQYVSIGKINSETTDIYHRLDISAGYTWPLKDGVLEAGLSVYNAYDHRSTTFVDYYQIPQEGSDFYSLGRKDISNLGITPSLFLKIRL